MLFVSVGFVNMKLNLTMAIFVHISLSEAWLKGNEMAASTAWSKYNTHARFPRSKMAD